jgi:hypothetical protein
MSKNFDLAMGAAVEMAERHAVGDFNAARDAQLIDNIDGWVGVWRRNAAGLPRLRWPRAICEAAKMSARARYWPREGDGK